MVYVAYRTNDLLVDSLESLNLYNIDSSWSMDMRKHEKGILTTKSHAAFASSKKNLALTKNRLWGSRQGL